MTYRHAALLCAFVLLDTLKAAASARVFHEQRASVYLVTLLIQCARYAVALWASRGAVTLLPWQVVPSLAWAVTALCMGYVQAAAATPAEAAAMAAVRILITVELLRGGRGKSCVIVLCALMLVAPAPFVFMLFFTWLSSLGAALAQSTAAHWLATPETTAGMHAFGVLVHFVAVATMAAMKTAGGDNPLGEPLHVDAVLLLMMCTTLCTVVSERMTTQCGSDAVETGNALSLVTKHAVFGQLHDARQTLLVLALSACVLSSKYM